MKAPTTTSQQEKILSRVESALFADTSHKSTEDNLTSGERESLKCWRKEQLFNKYGDLVMRTQDKGNRFVIVSIPSDIQKGNEQIDRSSFIKLDNDPGNVALKSSKDGLIKGIKKEKLQKNGVITLSMVYITR